MLARLPSHRHGQPFAITADPRVVYESTAFRSAFLALTNAIAVRAGLILLVGDPGCGKTVLLRTLRDAHARGNRPTFLRHATASGDLVAGLLADLHFDAMPADRKGRLLALAECLAQRPGPALLLVDEGDGLSHHQLAELAALADWRRGELDNLQIVVAGRPELKERIEQRRSAAATQPAVVTARLEPLLRDEINHYVARHLVLSRSRVSFESMALDRLHTHSQGLPLKINLLCTWALSRKARRIEAGDVDAAARFCGLIPVPAEEAVETATHAPRRVSSRRASAARRIGARVLRFGYRSVGFAGLAGLAFAIIHLFQLVGDVVRRDEGVQLVLDPQLQTGEIQRTEPAPRAYIAAAVKTLAEPGALLAPAILARPLASRGTELAQSVIETAPATAAPEPPRDNGDTSSLEQAIKAVNEADEVAAAAAALDERPAAGSQPDASPSAASTDTLPDAPPQPVITHLRPGGDSETPSGAPQPETAEQPAHEAATPVAPAPIEAPPPPAAAAAPARDPLSGAAAPSPPPSARAEALDTEQLMRRGQALLQEGDVASARLFFERAAATGHAAALTALGQSFDPLELQRLGVIGIKADPRRALEWYRAANAAGDAAAQERSARLSGWVERGQAAR